ncbi:MAG: tetratricopeptide repeat protein [Ignavibacteria bacterium]|jgi:tetratricopeptide (TPR) repeat protein|nr:tetratricopeptide repeat protein [Ignavibacteria bacterium]MCU7500586.1 tetratricopeptide repeat protein [Ignavibacteria bacterium]MCU7514135.1 tetratricopeptide repeat protein [Ignavibacteria bacterium]MCU7522108.1 tetratricopeptide repeat protein [Ignavibacteria bacterium]MCU7525799.1 tetratricopeptide repeat protein [Ignavibacteria bacterium]
MMKKVLFVLNILFIFSISAYAQQDTTKAGQQSMDPQAAKYYNKAVENMKAGNYPEAITSLDSSLQVAKDYRTYFLKGQALLKSGNLQDARTNFLSSIAIDSTYEQSLYALANADLALKNYDEAIYYYKKVAATTSTPKMKSDAESGIAFAQQNQAIEFYNKGNELQKANKFDEAVKSYDQALAIDPKDYKSYYQKGIALSRQDKNDDAIKAFNQALAVNDSLAPAYIALGGIMTSKKDYEGALKNYEKALTVTNNENLKTGIQEGITRTYLVLGNQYIKDRKYDKAIETFKKAADATNSDQAYLGLAKAYIDRKQYNDALTALQNADKNKKTVTAGAISFYTGVVNYEKGEKAKALDSFKAASQDATYKKASQSYITRINAEKGQAPAKK